jgi:predicted aspartyl protease
MIGIGGGFAHARRPSGRERPVRGESAFMVRVTAALLCSALVFCPAMLVDALDSPDLATVERQVEDAAGKRPAVERVIANFTNDGLTGQNVTVVSGKDRRTDSTLGPFKTAEGTFHGQRWQQNENGETVLVAPEPVEATGDPTTTKVTHVSQPFEAYVIAKLNVRGSGTKDYVDPATWRIVRHDIVRPTGTRTIAYDDFRTTAGYTRPWHSTHRDGHPENDEEFRIQSIDGSAVSDAQLAIPPNRRTLVEFPAGISSVSLPVRLSHGKFIVRVNVGGRGLDFILDTGASGIVIDRDIAGQLGLQEYGSYSSAVNAGRFTGTSVVVPTMKVGPLTMHDVVVSTTPHVGIDDPGEYKVVGLLGFDFIDAVALKLDYESGSITAMTPEAFQAPTDPYTIDLDVRLGTYRPATSVVVNGELGERFVLDTGGVGGLMIFDYFQRRYPDAMVDEGSIRNTTLTFHGVGGGFDAKPYKLRAIKIGQVTFTDFVAWAVASPASYSGNEDGLIGAGLLELFTVYTDYADGKMYLAPNALGRSGINSHN